MPRLKVLNRSMLLRLTDEKWQEIDEAMARQVNAPVRSRAEFIRKLIDEGLKGRQRAWRKAQRKRTDARGLLLHPDQLG